MKHVYESSTIIASISTLYTYVMVWWWIGGRSHLPIMIQVHNFVYQHHPLEPNRMATTNACSTLGQSILSMYVEYVDVDVCGARAARRLIHGCSCRRTACITVVDVWVGFVRSLASFEDSRSVWLQTFITGGGEGGAMDSRCWGSLSQQLLWRRARLCILRSLRRRAVCLVHGAGRCVVRWSRRRGAFFGHIRWVDGRQASPVFRRAGVCCVGMHTCDGCNSGRCL